MPFVYSPRYHADIGLHVFPVKKYRLVFEKLIHQAEVPPSEFFEPQPATDDDLLLVHTPEYLKDLHGCAWTHRIAYSELPISREIIDLFILVAGGTALACKLALEKGWCIHLGGGFHHAFPGHAEGFCYINDLAVGIRVVQRDGLLTKAAVIDCDLHQGNGTAVIFRDDEKVFTFSIHQKDLYPIKQKSSRDIHLPIGTTDETYLAHLEQEIPPILREFRPELVLYQAGADPYANDQLGSLHLTIDGLKRRDTYVFRQCKEYGIPVAVTLGGGYAYEVNDTVSIHFNTCTAAMEVFGTETKGYEENTR